MIRRSVIGLPASAAVSLRRVGHAAARRPRGRGRRRRPASRTGAEGSGADAWWVLSCVGGSGCVPRPCAAAVSVVTIAVSNGRCGHCGHGHTRTLVGAILVPCCTTARRREMTLAGQYLLLQVLIVLVVLVAVGAISVAQTARSFERSEVRPALSAAENLAANPSVRQRIAGRRARDRSGAGLGRGVGRAPCPGSHVGAARRTDGVVLVSSDPTQVGDTGRRSGRAGCSPGPSWTGTRDVGGAAVGRRPGAGVRRDDRRGRRAWPRSAAQVPSVWSRLGDVVPNLLVYLGRRQRARASAARCCSSRRVKRQTLGMEPTEIAGLVEHREALLHGVKEGVVALDRAAAGHAWSTTAPASCSGCRADCVGRRLDELDLDPQLRRGAHQPASPSPTGWCSSATGCSPSTAGRCAPTAR